MAKKGPKPRTTYVRMHEDVYAALHQAADEAGATVADVFDAMARRQFRLAEPPEAPSVHDVLDRAAGKAA